MFVSELQHSRGLLTLQREQIKRCLNTFSFALTQQTSGFRVMQRFLRHPGTNAAPSSVIKGQIVTFDLEITHTVADQSTGLLKISIHSWATLKDSAPLVPPTLHNPWSLHLLIPVSVSQESFVYPT